MFSADGITKPKLIHTVVLYDTATGEIRHIHSEVLYEGALQLDKDTTDKDRIERKAFELAEQKIGKEAD
jgi:hypothetical protein